MVSSVFVELMADGDEAPSSTTLVGEESEGISGRDVALGIGEEGMFRMESKIWHVSRVLGDPRRSIWRPIHFVGVLGSALFIIKNAI